MKITDPDNTDKPNDSVDHVEPDTTSLISADTALTDPFDSCLDYTDEMALHWSLSPVEPCATDLDQFNKANESLLKVTNLLGDHVVESEEFAELMPELARLDQKLNLILELQSLLLRQSLSMPETRLVRLSARGMDIPLLEGEFMPADHQIVAIDAFIQHELPKPLKLIGEVVDCNTLGEGERRFTVCFLGLSPGVEDWLEKFVFRHHRRIVARQRTS